MPTPQPRQALRAEWVIPVQRPPLSGGIVVVDQGRILEVTTVPPRGCKLIDLGHVALLPGLVNAHVHLDFSDCTAPLGTPGMSFANWLDLAIGRRRGEQSPGNEDPVRTISLGVRESLRHGTTTLADITRSELPAERERRNVDGLALLELIGLSAESAEAQRKRLEDWLASAVRIAAGSDHRWRAGISPHAPYSVRRELLGEAVSASQRTGMLVAMHLAESPEELELLDQQSGPLVDLLARWDAWDGSAFQPGLGPRDYLETLAQARRALVIHGNYLDADDHAFLAANADHLAVVYCPRTHHYFRHSRYPLADMLAAGVAVALGTDGRGTNADLSLLAELRHIAAVHPDVSPSQIISLGTLGGAAALGCAERVGSLTPGKDANLVAISLPEHADGDACAMLLKERAEVKLVLVRGVVVHPKPVV